MKCRIEVRSEAGRLFARGIARFYGLRVRVWYKGAPGPALLFEIGP